MTTTDVNAVLASVRSCLSQAEDGVLAVEPLLFLGPSDIEQAVFLLETLDMVDHLVRYFSVHSGRLHLSSKITSPACFISAVLAIDPRPAWIQQLEGPLSVLFFQASQTLDPKDAAPSLFVRCYPVGVNITVDAPFMMGSEQHMAHQMERPLHPVVLSPFWVAQTEVTQGLYWHLMGQNPSHQVGFSKPVENISWYDAIQFCNALSQSQHLDAAYIIHGETVQWNRDSKGYRLPTEAEWEYVAKAGGQPSQSIQDEAWHTQNWDGSAQAVMQLAPNQLGLFDLYGNVSEWCWDWFGPYAAPLSTNPAGAKTGQTKVHRGGGWSSLEAQFKAHTRASLSPNIAIPSVGLRLFRSR